MASRSDYKKHHYRQLEKATDWPVSCLMQVVADTVAAFCGLHTEMTMKYCARTSGSRITNYELHAK